MTIDQEVEDILEHFGVRGQKWGVRRERRANLLVKVGEGKATRIEKIRAGATTSALDLYRGKGFKGGAAIRGARTISRNARVKSGESSVRDKLVYYGGTKYQDVVPTKKGAHNTKAAVGATIAGVMLVGIGKTVVKNLLKNKSSSDSD